MRIRAIDWLRGLVMILMAVDHAGGVFDAAHLHGDSAARWVPGSLLPTGEFLTRWVSHLCAPTFVLLAGVSLALSCERRREQPGQSRFITTRGLLVAALDPLWMSMVFSGYQRFALQVLYALGFGMACMAVLRRLPTAAMLGVALAIQLFGELSSAWTPAMEPFQSLWKLLLVGGSLGPRVFCRYPLLPWLSSMMLGWVLGRWLLEPRSRAARAGTLAMTGLVLLGVFLAVRGIDGYGNWNLHRDSLEILQWLHVSKYPPSITYTTLEVGLALLLLAGLMTLDDPEKPRRALAPLALLGATAFFFYLLHFHLLGIASLILDLDRKSHGLAKTWIAAALIVLALLPLCRRYHRYKRAHPDGWTRYV
jgi:uncharacterized membrane protein